MDTTRGGGRHKILQMSVPKRWLTAGGRQRGGNKKVDGKSENEKKKKKRKRRRTATPRGGVVSVCSPGSLHLPFSVGGCAGYTADTNKQSGSYRRSNKCRTFTFSSEGGLLSFFSLLLFLSLFLLNVIFPRSVFPRLSLLLFPRASTYRASIFLSPRLSLSLSLVLFLCAALARVAHVR